ncbi:MAG: TIM barrel protein [Acidobacteriota bacterium]
MLTRRHFSKLALTVPVTAPLAGLAQKRIDSRVAGVMLGAQSYSFREKPFDQMVQAFVDTQLGECELFAPHIEPKLGREELRKWRSTVSLDEFRNARKKFDAAGVNLYAYNYSFKDDFTDEEIERGFEMSKALGVHVITASSTISVAKRVAPFAEKHKMKVAYHGHSDVTHPNEFATPESFSQALAMSKQFAINLDIGHFTAANYDPFQYLKDHHDQILVLHLKDRKKNQGANTPWGEGDTPIKEVLQLLKREKWPIRALVEYEYKGASDSVTEVRKCVEFCKAALA